MKNAKFQLKVWTSIMVFVFLLAVCRLAAYAGTPDSAIKKIDVDGLYSVEKDELLDILNIKIGEPLNAFKVRNGIRLAFLKGIFEDISVEADDRDKTHVIIKIKEKDIIKSIRISGNDFFSKKTIKEHFLFKEDQAMRYDLIGDAVKGLRDALSERGFPDSDVELQVENAKEPYRINLLLKIKEALPMTVKTIKINGPEEVRSIMNMSEGGIYDQFKLRKDLDRIKAQYKRENYLSPVVGPYVFNEGNLTIYIDPGKKLNVAFEGNNSISSRDLLKEAPFFEAEDFRDDLVEEAVSRIISSYHEKGYPFAQVAPVITSAEDSISVHFFIFEGKRVFVNAITFSGVTADDKNLKEIMSLKEGDLYNPDFVNADRTTLVEFYNALGYLNANIADVQVKIDDIRADISIEITEGKRIRIESIEIKGAEQIPAEEVKRAVKIKPGDPYNEVDISDARYRIIELYENYGFGSTIVEIKQEIKEESANIVFEVNEGQVIFFGKTLISGNSDTKSKVIKRELLYKEGESFNYNLISKTRQRLYKLGLFSDVDAEIMENEDNIRNVHLKVKEGNAGAVEFGIGYGDYERYRGSFDISYRNLFGMNRQISFRTELSSLERRYIVNYIEPWFLDMPVPFRLIFLREERTERNMETHETRYRLTRHTASAGIEKKLSERFKSEIFYEFSVVRTFDVQPDIILTKEDTGTLIISGIRPGIIYDTRDNPFDPRRGVLAGVSIKAASGMLFSETDFIKVIVNGSTYRELHKDIILALSLKGGIAEGFNKTEELPLIERFFLGGRTTVRGYEQDMLGPKGENGSPTGGNAFVLANVELRTSIGKGFGFVTFLDGGNVWVKASEVKLSEMKYTAGVGIRYNTPVGPIRVDYGHKLQREEGESSGELHFSIGHAF